MAILNNISKDTKLEFVQPKPIIYVNVGEEFDVTDEIAFAFKVKTMDSFMDYVNVFGSTFTAIEDKLEQLSKTYKRELNFDDLYLYLTFDLGEWHDSSTFIHEKMSHVYVTLPNITKPGRFLMIKGFTEKEENILIPKLYAALYKYMHITRNSDSINSVCFIEFVNVLENFREKIGSNEFIIDNTEGLAFSLGQVNAERKRNPAARVVIPSINMNLLKNCILCFNGDDTHRV